MRFSQRGREQWCELVLPAPQGVVVRVNSPSATGSNSPSAAGSSGACWFSQRGREQWYVIDSSLLILLFVVSYFFDSYCFRSVGF